MRLTRATIDLIRTAYRGHPAVATRAMALVACLTFMSERSYSEQPPSDSLASKYAPKPGDPKPEAKPQSLSEPDPKMDCPWLSHIFDDQPVMSLGDNREEFYAYNYFVLHARKFAPELLAKHANRKITWRSMFGDDRDKYRGEIVHVEGRLKRLTWIGSNKSLESQGVKDLYEAWIFGEHYFSNPTCVIVSELPPGVEPAEDIRDVNVSADGYFFKRYKYKAVNDTRLAPLVIGRTMAVVPPPEVPADLGAQAFGRLFVPTALTLVLGMVVSAFLLHRWFRQGDRHVYGKLLEARANEEFIAPIDEPPPARGLPDEPSRN